MDREGSLPILVEYLKEGIEPLIDSRTYVLINRYLRGWGELYLDKPPRLTLEGGTLLLKKWLVGIKLPRKEKK